MSWFEFVGAIIFVLTGLYESYATLVMGPPKWKDTKISKWLKNIDELRLSVLSYSIFKRSEFNHGVPYYYIRQHRFTFLSKYFVSKHTEEGEELFRVMRGSPLHVEIEETWEELANRGTHTEFKTKDE